MKSNEKVQRAGATALDDPTNPGSAGSAATARSGADMARIVRAGQEY